MSDETNSQDCEQPNPNNSGNTSIPRPENAIRPENNMPTEKSSKGQMSVDSFPQPSQKTPRTLGSFNSTKKQDAPIEEVARQNTKSNSDIQDAPDGSIKKEENIGETYVSGGKINVEVESTDNRNSKNIDGIDVPTNREKKDSNEVGETKPKTKLEEQLTIPTDRKLKLDEGEFDLPRKTKVENAVSIEFNRQTKESTTEINTTPTQKQEVETDIFGQRRGKEETTSTVDTPDSNKKDEEDVETRDSNIGIKDLNPNEVSTNFKPTSKSENEVPTVVATNFPKKDKTVDTSYDINYQEKKETTKTVDNQDKSPKTESSVEQRSSKYSIKKEESFDVTSNQNLKTEEETTPRASSNQYAIKNGTNVDTSYDINYQEKSEEDIDTSYDIDFQEKSEEDVDRIQETTVYDTKEDEDIDTSYDIDFQEKSEENVGDINHKTTYTVKKEESVDTTYNIKYDEKQNNLSDVEVEKDFDFESKQPNEQEVNVNKDFDFKLKTQDNEIDVSKDFDFESKQPNESEVNVNKDFNFKLKTQDNEIDVNKDFNFEIKTQDNEIDVNRDFFYAEKVENESEIEVNKDFNFEHKLPNESEVNVNKDFNFEHKLPNEFEIDVNKNFNFEEKKPNEQELETPGLQEARDFGGNYKPTPYEVDEQLAGVSDTQTDVKNDFDIISPQEYIDYGISINRSSTTRSGVLEEGYADNDIKLDGRSGDLFDYNTYTNYQNLENTTDYYNSTKGSTQFYNANRRTVYDGYQDESNRDIDTSSNTGYSVSSSSKTRTYKKDEAAEDDSIIVDNLRPSIFTDMVDVNPDYSSNSSYIVSRMGTNGERLKDSLNSDNNDRETNASSSYRITTYKKALTSTYINLIDVDGESVKVTALATTNYDYSDINSEEAEAKNDNVLGGNIDISNYTKEPAETVDLSGDINVINKTQGVIQTSNSNPDININSTDYKIDSSFGDGETIIDMANYTYEIPDTDVDLNVVLSSGNWDTIVKGQKSNVNSIYHNETNDTNQIIGSRNTFKDAPDDSNWDYSVNYSNFKAADGTGQLLNSIDQTRPTSQEFSKFTYDVNSDEAEQKKDGTTNANIAMNDYAQDIVDNSGVAIDFGSITSNVIASDQSTYDGYTIQQKSGINPSYNISSYSNRPTPSSINVGDDPGTTEDESGQRQPLADRRGMKNSISTNIVPNTIDDVEGDATTYDGTYQAIHNDSGEITGYVYHNQESERFDYSGIDTSISETKWSFNSSDIGDIHQTMPNDASTISMNVVASEVSVYDGYTKGQSSGENKTYNISSYYRRTIPAEPIITNLDDPETEENEEETWSPLSNRRGFKNTYVTTGSINVTNDVNNDASTYDGAVKPRYDSEGNVVGHFYYEQENSNFVYSPNLNQILGSVGAGSRALKNDDKYSTNYNDWSGWWDAPLELGSFNADLQVDIPNPIREGYIEWGFDPSKEPADMITFENDISGWADNASIEGELGPAFTSDRYGSPNYTMPNINSSVSPNPDESLYPQGNTGLSATRFIEASEGSDLLNQILNNSLRASGFDSAVSAVGEIVNNIGQIASPTAWSDFGTGVDLNDDYVNLIRRSVTTELPSILLSMKRSFDVTGASGAGNDWLETTLDTLGIAGDLAETAGSAMNQPGAFLANALRGESGIVDLFTGGGGDEINVLSQGTDGKHGGVNGLGLGFGGNRFKDYDINDSFATGSDYWTVNAAPDSGLLRLSLNEPGGNLYNKDLIRSNVPIDDIDIRNIAESLGITEAAAHKSLLSSYEGIRYDLGVFELDTLGVINPDDYDPNYYRENFGGHKPFGFNDNWYVNNNRVSRSGRLIRDQRTDDETSEITINGSNITIDSKIPYGSDNVDFILGPQDVENGISFKAAFGLVNDDGGLNDDRLGRVTVSESDDFYKKIFTNASIGDGKLTYSDLENQDPHRIDVQGYSPDGIQFSGEENLTGKDIFYNNFKDNFISLSSFGKGLESPDENSLIFNTGELIGSLKTDGNLNKLSSIEYHPDTFYDKDGNERSFYLDNLFISSNHQEITPYNVYNIRSNEIEEGFTDPHLVGYTYPSQKDGDGQDNQSERIEHPGQYYGMRGQFQKLIDESDDGFSHIVFANSLNFTEVNRRIQDENLDRKNFITTVNDPATIYDDNSFYGSPIDENWSGTMVSRSKNILSNLSGDKYQKNLESEGYVDPHLLEYVYNEDGRSPESTFSYGPKGKFYQLLNDEEQLINTSNLISSITTDNQDVVKKLTHTRVGGENPELLQNMWANNINGVNRDSISSLNLETRGFDNDPHFFEYSTPQNDRNPISRIKYGPKGSFYEMFDNDDDNGYDIYTAFVTGIETEGNHIKSLYSFNEDISSVKSDNNYYTKFSNNDDQGDFVMSESYNISDKENTDFSDGAYVDPHFIGYTKGYNVEAPSNDEAATINIANDTKKLQYAQMGARGKFLEQLEDFASNSFTLFKTGSNEVTNLFQTNSNENLENIMTNKDSDNPNALSREDISHFIPRWVSPESADGVLWKWETTIDEEDRPSSRVRNLLSKGGPKYKLIYSQGAGNNGVGIRLEDNDLSGSGGLFGPSSGGSYTHTFRDIPIVQNPGGTIIDYEAGDQTQKHVHANYIVASSEYVTNLTAEDEGLDTSQLTYEKDEDGMWVYNGVDNNEASLMEVSNNADFGGGNSHEETLNPIMSAIGPISDELKSTLEVSSKPENRAKKRPYAISKWHNSEEDITIMGDSAQRAAGFGTRTASVNSFSRDLQDPESQISRDDMLININTFKYLETHRTVDDELVNTDERDKTGEGFIAALKNARGSFGTDSDNVVFDIPFQFHADLSGETRAADWATETSIGRTSEFFIWSKTGTRTIQLKTTYAIMYDGESTISADLSWGEFFTEDEVMKILNKYRSLVLPLSRTGADNPISPPSIVIVGGKYLQSSSDQNMSSSGPELDFSRWVAQDINIDPKYEMGHTNTRTPFAYEISMTLKEVFSWIDYQSYDTISSKLGI